MAYLNNTLEASDLVLKHANKYSTILISVKKS